MSDSNLNALSHSIALSMLFLSVSACGLRQDNSGKSGTQGETDSGLGLRGSRQVVVGNPEALKKALNAAKAGDVIVLRNGVYNDLSIVLSGNGESGRPIALQGESLGGVVLKGRSNVVMRGKFLSVAGLVFKEGFAPNSVIALGDEKGKCNSCEVSAVRIEDYNPSDKGTKSYWVTFDGKNSKLINSTLKGKSNWGPMVAVIRDNNDLNQHIIQSNEFLDQPKGNKNGFEVIRIGTGTHANSDSGTLVERNLFENCLGETEIISNKSGNNIIRFNTLRSNAGGITLRNGHNNVVEGNYVLGSGVSGSYGIRITGKNNLVSKNHIEGTASSTHHSISIIAAHQIVNQNGDDADYNLATGNIVSFNAIINPRSGGGLILGNTQGSKGPFGPPTGNTIASNFVRVENPQPALTIAAADVAANKMINNLYDGSELSALSGWTKKSLSFAVKDSLTVLSDSTLVRLNQSEFPMGGKSVMNGKSIYEHHLPLARGVAGAQLSIYPPRILEASSQGKASRNHPK
ncbi:MAG: hypothetical protein RIR26_1546 [Pseudomonadota bacterium]|jgi:parallel beta-helix repeat protein